MNVYVVLEDTYSPCIKSVHATYDHAFGSLTDNEREALEDQLLYTKEAQAYNATVVRLKKEAEEQKRMSKVIYTEPWPTLRQSPRCETWIEEHTVKGV